MKIGSWAAALAVGLVVAACGFPDPKVEVTGALPLELPYREAKGGLVILRGRVNGLEEVDFILDTGAPVSVLLDGSRTTKLGFDTSRARPLGDPASPGTPVGIVQPSVRIAFDGLALSGLSVVVIPEKSLPCRERFEEINFAGVIGADLFRNFVVEIDSVGKRVRFHDPRTWKPVAGASVVPLAFNEGHPHLAVTVKLPSGETVTENMNLDIGMNRALSLVAGSNPAIAMPKEGTPRKSCYVNGIREDRVGAPVDVTLGTSTVRVESPNYTEHANVVGGRRNGTIGVSLFQGQRLTIDYPGKRIAVG